MRRALIQPRQLDIPHACTGLINDHCNTDVHLSDELWLLHRRVRQFFFTAFHYAQCGRFLGSVRDSGLKRGPRMVSNAKCLPVVHVACEQHPAATPQSTTLSMNLDEDLCNKPQGLSPVNDLERGVRQ